MIDIIISIFQSTYDTLYVATFIVAVFLFLSGLDDLFVDLYYWFNNIFNKKRMNKYRYMKPEEMEDVP
ncbi:MAG: hypothetical protein KJ963_04005, partial [Bacteroidetes bacterium]|nr:hypothetical protein [Bacteroidota bacterium]